MKQKKYLGEYAVKKIKIILNKLKPKRIFLVIDKNVYEKCGAKKELTFFLRKYQCNYFGDFTPNPEMSSVDKGVKKFNKDNPDLVIAVGGGSTIDVAKAIKYFSKSKVKLIAIPTTIGTGSEATCFATIYDGKEKLSLTRKYLLPNYAIIDTNFFKSINKKQLSLGIADSFCHAVESHISNKSTEESKKYAARSIYLLLNYAKKKNLHMLALASHLSGKAINISKTNLSHAISYYLTKKHRIPHGQAVAITLPAVIYFNYGSTHGDLNDNRGFQYHKNNMRKLFKLLNTNNVLEAVSAIEEFFESLGLKTSLTDLKIYKKDFDKIAGNVNLERVKTNPRKVNKNKIRKILMQCS